MPLPAALAARLAKRGIIQSQAKSNKNSDSAAEPKEEVFAESYDADDADKSGGRRAVNNDTLDTGFPGCPNKWNVYHNCVLACQHRWGGGKTTPDADYAEKHKKMMAKYGPLPDGWREQYDPGTGRHYYWCTRTDRVTWLPPSHPKAKLTEAASQIREMVQLHEEDDDEDDSEDDDDSEDEDEEAMDLDSDMSDDDEERSRRGRRGSHHKSRTDSSRRSGASGSRRGGGDRVDPMDPSSYSDAPKGTWSSGLDKAQDKA